ncbi:MAG: sensor histidine kinase [Clostridiales bacterium]|nr:sensor histidine kinase [Clostridiales bacterium]
MKVFIEWLRSIFPALILGIACYGLCFALFALSHLQTDVVAYAGILCAVLVLIFLFFNFLGFRKRHKTLEKLGVEITVTLEHLPEGGSLIERDYANLLHTLDAECRAIQSDAQRKDNDMMEYYTAWAHQIKTPIAAMKLLLGEEDTDLGRQLRDELQRIEQYVDMVMGYLRLDGDGNDYVLRTYQVDDVVRHAIRDYAGQFIRKKLKLNYEGINYEALTDEKWLCFVIEQVLSNSLKYTETGSVTISMENPGELVIADTGIGIAPEDLPRVFERGYTGTNGRIDRHASGIGLYLCRLIMERLGHGISVESALGEGTRVTLKIHQQN